MKKIKALAIFNALSLISNCCFVYLVREKLVNQKDIQEVAVKYDSLFIPADFTFGIWGIIYTTLGVLCLYHIVIAYKHDKWNPANKELSRMNLLFIVTNLAGIAWLLAWTHELLLASVLLIFVQVICLVVIHRRLNIYDKFKPAGLKVCSQFPLSIYLGWTSMAAIANTSSWLVAIGWSGFGLGASEWFLIMISFVVALSLVMIFFRRNIYFGLAMSWGLYGITLKRDFLNVDQYNGMMVTAWLAIGVILLSCFVQWLNNLSYKKPATVFPSAAAPLK